MKIKICIKCKQKKLTECFTNDATRKDGLYPYCKSCYNAIRKKNYSDKFGGLVDVCRVCGQTKPIKKFHRSKINTNFCLECWKTKTHKKCTKCLNSVPVGDFYPNKRTNDGLNDCCKQCDSKNSKKWRDNNPKKDTQRRSTYWKNNRKDLLLKNREYYKTPHGIFLHTRKSAKKRGIAFDISAAEFEYWWDTQDQKCHYCGLSKEDLNRLEKWGNLKTKRMTIDRIDSSKGYSLDNIVVACIMCNVIKNRFLSEEEMLEIGKTIQKKWQILLKQEKREGQA